MGLNSRNLGRLGMAIVAVMGAVLAVATGSLRIDNIPEALVFLCVGTMIALVIEKGTAKDHT